MSADQPDEVDPGGGAACAAAPRPQATPGRHPRARCRARICGGLQATLFELSECRRLLDNAMQKDESTD